MQVKKMQDKRLKDLQILMDFLQVYCEKKHESKSKNTWTQQELETSIELCEECETTMKYSAKRLKYCPLTPKPACKNCEIHCYAPEQRHKIRKIMRYSGIQLIKKGRVRYILHYLF
jgi:hypothetical protein